MVPYKSLLSKSAYLFVCTGLSFWNKEEKKGSEEMKEGEKERKENSANKYVIKL